MTNIEQFKNSPCFAVFNDLKLEAVDNREAQSVFVREDMLLQYLVADSTSDRHVSVQRTLSAKSASGPVSAGSSNGELLHVAACDVRMRLMKCEHERLP